MRINDSNISRRGAFFFIALFSCLQIFLGFFLITGKGHDSAAALAVQQNPSDAATDPSDNSADTPQKFAQFRMIKAYEAP